MSAARGDAREDVRVVREEDDRVFGACLPQRAFDVRRARPQVCDTGQPEAPPTRLDSHGLVLKHVQTRPAQCTRDALAVVPPVVVPEHGVDAERRAQGPQLFGYRLRFDERAAEHAAALAALVRRAADDEVAGDEHEVGRLLVHTLDDFTQALQTHVRRADVQVCEQRDLQPPVLRAPTGHGQTDVTDDRPRRLQPERPHREADHHDEDDGQRDPQSRFEEASH